MWNRLLGSWRTLAAHSGYPGHRARSLMRVALWAGHCAFRRPANLRFERWGFSLFLPPAWQGGGSTAAFVFRENYDPDLALLEWLLGPGMVFVDGGANIGLYACFAAALVGLSGKVLAFEPGERSFAALLRSVALNRFTQVQARRSALSDRSGTATLYHHGSREDSFGLGGPEQTAGNTTSETVPTTTIDESVQALGLSTVDVIKLDVEGAQEPALRGAELTLTRFQPFVLVEVDRTATRRLGLEPDGARRFLESLDYQLHGVDRTGRLCPLDGPQWIRTFLAVPARSSHRIESLPRVD